MRCTIKAKTKYRYRLTFSKKDRVKYVAHLDTVTTWTRAFRRANIPLAYSQGFSPQAKIQVASSLPLGYMSNAELMDIYLTEAIEPTEILSKVNNTLPPGFQLLSVQTVPANAPALQAQLRQASYQVTVETELTEIELNKRINTLLAQDKVMQSRIRRKKHETFNLRPLLHSLKLIELKNGDATLSMTVSSGAHGSLRPESILKTLGLEDTWYQVERHKLIFTFDN